MINNLDDLLRVVSLGGSIVLLSVVLLVSRPPRPASRLVRLGAVTFASFMLVYGLGGSAGVSTAISAAVLIVSLVVMALVAG